MAETIKVLVVDDSAFMRKIISDILQSTEDIKVIATAKDGKDALEKTIALKPDVITLDVEMPVMDGLTCLKELQKLTSVPVLMLSNLTQSGAAATIEALAAGAIDFVSKPTGLFDIAGEEKMQEIIEKVRMAKGIKKGKLAAGAAKEQPRITVRSIVTRSNTLKAIIAIGTSTGGPKALQEVLPLIPGDIPAAVLVVQHMPAGFTKSLADRLNTLSELTVKEAEDGDIIQPGHAYIAPGDFHMKVSNASDGVMKITTTKEPQVGGHRPAVDVMMNSIAETGYQNVIGVIMTGMGADGSAGIKNLKKCNKGYIISQDEKSCVVYGMPRAAVLAGVVDSVVPLKGIAKEIVKNLGVY